jgi:hypothetical protein
MQLLQPGPPEFLLDIIYTHYINTTNPSLPPSNLNASTIISAALLSALVPLHRSIPPEVRR